MKRFEILEDGPDRFVLADNSSDDPCPVFPTKGEAESERLRLQTETSTRALTILNETGDVTMSRAQAMACSAPVYFTGKMCSKGHIAFRNTSNSMCKDCQAIHNSSPEQKIRLRNWAAANGDKIVEYNQESYARHADERRAYAKARYEADPERCKEEQRRRRLKSPAAVRDIRRRSRNKNKAKYIAVNERWRDKNREKILAFNRNYRARRRGAEGKHTAEDVICILRMQRQRCAYCPTKFTGRVERHVDHIIALSRGGTNDRKNLQILCQPCNNQKYNHDPIDFAQSIGLLL